VDETKVNSHEADAEAKIALIFSAKFYIQTPFSKKTKFSVDFRRNLIFRLQTGSNMGTLLVITYKTTSYAFGRRLLLLCLHTK